MIDETMWWSAWALAAALKLTARLDLEMIHVWHALIVGIDFLVISQSDL
jgi:hypothetical protein